EEVARIVHNKASLGTTPVFVKPEAVKHGFLPAVGAWGQFEHRTVHVRPTRLRRTVQVTFSVKDQTRYGAATVGTVGMAAEVIKNCLGPPTVPPGRQFQGGAAVAFRSASDG